MRPLIVTPEQYADGWLRRRELFAWVRPCGPALIERNHYADHPSAPRDERGRPQTLPCGNWLVVDPREPAPSEGER